MLKKIFNKFKLRKETPHKTVENNIVLKEKEESVFDITITEENNIFKVEISDYITINDYVERMESIDGTDLMNLISNNILWNSGRQRVNKGTFNIINREGKLYNILINKEAEKFLKIDERIKIDDVTEERILSFGNDDYTYCSLKHDKTGSTFFTKYYGKNGTCIPALELTDEEAFQEIQSVICNLDEIEEIKSILDIDLLKHNVLGDIKGKSQIKKI